MRAVYASQFVPSAYVREEILQKGNITAPGETPAQMVERIAQMLYVQDKQFVSRNGASRFAHEVGGLMDQGAVVFSTPVMTNAGRREFKRPLSACTVPPVNLMGDLSAVRHLVDTCHREAMGTGFNFDEATDPVSILLFLNQVAVEGAESGTEDRPVGNMGICSVDHPRIVDFVTAKMLRREMLWKFNVSVNTPEAFWLAVEENGLWTLRNGMTIYAQELFRLIAQAAHACADPGLVFMERMNGDNPVPGMGRYVSVAPCAEVGLMPGEACQFGYLNLGTFVSGKALDLDRLKLAAGLMVRSLDNCLDASIQAYEIQANREVMKRRRKIGVGICGLADMLIELGVPYSSEEGRELARNIVAFINYHSKVASHELARQRGSFGAMSMAIGCRYNEPSGFIEQKYGFLNTRWVRAKDWLELGRKIRETRLMRNCSTVALPPTGRSGLVINASTGVEPVFRLTGPDGAILPAVARTLGSSIDSAVEDHLLKHGRLGPHCPHLASLLATSTEIKPIDHVLMVAAIQPAVDESISKTINLPQEATVADVEEIYRLAYRLGLKGMTVYRDKSNADQPRKL